MPSMHANHRDCLYSPIKISNCLPMTLRFDLDDELNKSDEQSSTFNSLINPGENLNIHLILKKLVSCKVHISNYLNASWLGVIDWSKLMNDKTDTYRLDMTIAPTTEMQINENC